MAQRNQKGFSAVEAVIVIAVLAALGFVGYGVYNRQDAKPAATSTMQSAAQSSDTTTPEISSDKDLETAEVLLEQADVESASDSSELESDLSGF